MPTPPTNTAFRNTMQALSVTGVTRHYDYPPPSLNSGDLPAAFCLPPDAELAEFVVSCTAQNKSRSMGFVICLEAVGQDDAERNYDLIAPAMDNLETALDAALVATYTNFYSYTITSGTYDVAGVDYWAIIAEVTISGV